MADIHWHYKAGSMTENVKHNILDSVIVLQSHGQAYANLEVSFKVSMKSPRSFDQKNIAKTAFSTKYVNHWFHMKLWNVITHPSPNPKAP